MRFAFERAGSRRALSIENGEYRNGPSLNNAKCPVGGEAPFEPWCSGLGRQSQAPPEKYLAPSPAGFRFMAMKGN
jgi:hypothetical protein